MGGGSGGFPSSFLPGPFGMFHPMLGEAMQRMKMEAKAHETERRVKLIIIENRSICHTGNECVHV